MERIKHNLGRGQGHGASVPAAGPPIERAMPPHRVPMFWRSRPMTCASTIRSGSPQKPLQSDGRKPRNEESLWAKHRTWTPMSRSERLQTKEQVRSVRIRAGACQLRGICAARPAPPVAARFAILTRFALANSRIVSDCDQNQTFREGIVAKPWPTPSQLRRFGGMQDSCLPQFAPKHRLNAPTAP